VSSELERGQFGPLAESWRAAWVDGGFDSFCTPDVSYEDPLAVEPLRGPEALDRHAAWLRASFPDLKLDPTSPPLGHGDFACLPWRAIGTHRGDGASLLPGTERFVAVHGLHYVELTDGLIRRARGFFDLYDAAVQLGLLPARGGLGETALLMARGFGLRRRSQAPPD
jgi:SnoaL-like polyketide cyclase